VKEQMRVGNDDRVGGSVRRDRIDMRVRRRVLRIVAVSRKRGVKFASVVQFESAPCPG